MNDSGVAAFIGDRFLAGAAPSSIALMVAALRHAAKEGGLPDPVKRTIRRMAKIRRKANGRGQGRAGHRVQELLYSAGDPKERDA